MGVLYPKTPLTYPSFTVKCLNSVWGRVNSLSPRLYQPPLFGLNISIATPSTFYWVELINASIPLQLQKNSLSATTVTINYNSWVQYLQQFLYPASEYFAYICIMQWRVCRTSFKVLCAAANAKIVFYYSCTTVNYWHYHYVIDLKNWWN